MSRSGFVDFMRERLAEYAPLLRLELRDILRVERDRQRDVTFIVRGGRRSRESFPVDLLACQKERCAVDGRGHPACNPLLTQVGPLVDARAIASFAGEEAACIAFVLPRLCDWLAWQWETVGGRHYCGQAWMALDGTEGRYNLCLGVWTTN